MISIETYHSLINELKQSNLIAVTKNKPIETIQTLYNLGQRDFGENKVQELIAKKQHLPQDIRWHLIGHLQSNKVRSNSTYLFNTLR